MIQFAHQINDDSMIHLMMKGEMNEDRLFFLDRLTEPACLHPKSVHDLCQGAPKKFFSV